MLGKAIWEQTVTTAFTHPAPAEKASWAASLVKIYPLNVHEGMLQLPASVFTIGRDGQSDLWIDDSSISRTHARIEPTANGFRVQDLSSTNGTYVNDQRIESAVLKAGDQLRFGNHIFKVLGANDLEGQFLETIYTRMIRDGLTGAYNKRYLLDALERDLKRSQRHARPLAVAVLDIDHFKSVNDTYGHLVGDEVLREFCRRMIQTLRQDDIFARYGGEEFVAVLNETTAEQAAVIVEDCRAAIAEPLINTTVAEIAVTVSIGLASVPLTAGMSALELLAVADKKLYEAKRSGRNRVRA